MKLTSMTKFVLQEKEKFSKLGKENYDNTCLVKSYDIVFKYAEFMCQRLELGMFVPCDEEGNVLKEITEPNKSDYWSDNDTVFSAELYRNNLEEFKKYKKAKEKVLFEGFSLGEYSNGTQYIRQLSKYVIINEIIYDDHQDHAPRTTQDTVESILEYMNPELTPYALKQIGL